jgi:pilus assembly protein Flp/PilA
LLACFESQLAKLGNQHHLGDDIMNSMFLRMYVKFQELQSREDGQDLVEYALLVSLIALAAITGVQNVTTAITKVFQNISNSIV